MLCLGTYGQSRGNWVATPNSASCRRERRLVWVSWCPCPPSTRKSRRAATTQHGSKEARWLTWNSAVRSESWSWLGVKSRVESVSRLQGICGWAWQDRGTCKDAWKASIQFGVFHFTGVLGWLYKAGVQLQGQMQSTQKACSPARGTCRISFPFLLSGWLLRQQRHLS